MIVLITDGNPTVEVDFLQAEARLIKSLGTRIVGVGVTSEVADCADIIIVIIIVIISIPPCSKVSRFSKIQIGFTFLVQAHLGSPREGPLNGCVCVCVCDPAPVIND